MYTTLKTYARRYLVEQQNDYPYTAKDGTCFHQESKGVVKGADAFRVTKSSVAALKAAIAQQPIAVSIEADTIVFQSYTSGILNSARCGTNLDHGVLAVGYGTENGQDFYIVKNSWGTSWGLSGYVKIAAVEGSGICGIQLDSSYPSI